jgi:hypothetical protein
MHWTQDGAHHIARHDRGGDDDTHLHIEAALVAGNFLIETVARDGAITTASLDRATLERAKAVAEVMLGEKR